MFRQLELKDEDCHNVKVFMWNDKSEEEMEVGEEVTIFALDVNISERGFALYSRPSTHIQVSGM